MSFDPAQVAVLIPVVAIVTAGAAAVVFMAISALRDRAVARDAEQSRREIAAYVAEGSMSPQEGERLLLAGRAGGKRRGEA